LKKIKRILIIIQRSNGDVLFSSSLIKALYEEYKLPHIDLLINDDTLAVAKLIPFIKNIYTFSYKEKQRNRFKQEKNILINIYKKYDLSINLTSSDRSVLYALIASKKSISVVEKDQKKSWWKKIFLSNFYFYDNSKHILTQNLTPLTFLGIKQGNIHHSIDPNSKALISIQNRLSDKGIKEFYIFHPSAQYLYKILAQNLRNELLISLSKLGASVIITGSRNNIDLNIKKNLPYLDNVYDFIGETSMEEYVALSQLSIAYIGMDTLNMHIAAAQNKRIFAVFGPTNLKIWSPWSNELQTSARFNMPIQTYGNITIFQANMPCVACHRAGCDGSGKSKCLDNISTQGIIDEIKNWVKNAKL
jgi:heptosyltransferase-3